MYLSKNDPNDVLKLAKCLVLRKQYHRASNLLRKHGLDTGGRDSEGGGGGGLISAIEGIYLAARSAHESGHHQEALALLDNGTELYAKAKEEVNCLQQDNRKTTAGGVGGATPADGPGHRGRLGACGVRRGPGG